MHKNVSARTQNATNQQPSQQQQQQRPQGGVNSGWQKPNNFRQGNVRVYCSYCKMNNHSLDKCFRRPRDNQPVGLVTASSNHLSINPYLFSVKVLSQAFSNDGVFIMGYRDTGASVTLLIEGSVPSRYISMIGETIEVISANGHADRVPLCKIHVMSEMVSGHITVALVPRTYTLPGYCQFLLGNNFGDELVPAKSVTDKTKTVAAAVTTRSMTKKRTHADTAAASSGESTCSKTQQNIHVNTAPPTDEAKLTPTAENSVLPHAQTETTNKQNADIGLSTFDDELGETMQALFNEQHDFNIGEITSKQLIELQREDQSLTELWEGISEPHNLADDRISCYVNDKGLLARKFRNVNDDNTSYNEVHQIVVPKCLRGKILKLAHDVAVGGHMGIAKTRDKILRYFWWPSIHKEVKQYVRSCDVCQRNDKTCKEGKAPMVCPPIISKIFSRVSCDIVGPLPVCKKSQNRFILTCMDHATRYVDCYPLKDHQASTIVQAMMEYIARYGNIDELLCDLGSEFQSLLFETFTNFFGIKQIRCSVAHPQSNAVERWHRTLKDMLRAYIDQHPDEDWDESLPYLMFAYRDMPIADVGFSPYELLYGRPIKGPLGIVFENWWEDEEAQVPQNVVNYMLTLRDRLEDAMAIVSTEKQKVQLKNKQWYDKKARQVKYNVGDDVLVLQPLAGKPLDLKRVGPY